MAEPLKAQSTSPDPNEKLVKVFDSEQESEALVVKGLLDSAGIESDLTSASMVQDTFPGLGGMIILVREDDADAAKRLIADYRRPAANDDQTNNDQTSDDEASDGTSDDETAEIRTSEVPPQKP